MTPQSDTQPDPEITAISEVYSTLKVLEPDAQMRVLRYVLDKLKLKLELESGSTRNRDRAIIDEDTIDETQQRHTEASHREESEEEEGYGISPGGQKWMTRNSLTANDLSSIFSIGGEEIDLVARKVPGESKSKRMRSVFLLKGLAAYLATGAARFAHTDVKETCLHYDAFDAANFAQNFRGMISEVSGSKDTGYTLTQRGLTAAAEIVKQLVQKPEP
jgi:hypothetical protein